MDENYLQMQLDALKPADKARNPWIDARNGWVKRLPPVTKGKLAERLYVRVFGGSVMQNNRAGYDIEHGEMRVESKLSTRSYSGTNCYLWNQVRPTDPYTHLWLVAIDTDLIRAFLIPRDELPGSVLWKQHGRTVGEENTYVIKTSVADPIPDWLAAHEVALAEAE